MEKTTVTDTLDTSKNTGSQPGHTDTDTPAVTPDTQADLGSTQGGINMCGLTYEDAARVLGVSARTVKSYKLGQRGYTAAQQAALVSAATGCAVTGTDTNGHSKDVVSAARNAENLSGPFMVSSPEQVRSGKWIPKEEVAGAKACYKSRRGKEWDILSDGLARGYPGDSTYMRLEFRTPSAYFRIIADQAVHDAMRMRVTKHDFDKVSWKGLSLPHFETIGKTVRDRLPDVDHSKAVQK